MINMKTSISEYTIEELILFKNISPIMDDFKWIEIWNDIDPKTNGTLYEEIKYYYNMKVLPLIREDKLKNLLDEQ